MFKKFFILILLPLFLSSCSLSVTTPKEINTQNQKAERVTKVAVYGDSRHNNDVHQKIAESILGFQPEAIFHVGDLVDGPYSKEEWNIINGIISPLLQTSQFYVAAGNHEKESRQYYDNFTLPGNEKWYAVDIANAHFIVLNTNIDLLPESEQYQWLEQELIKTERDKFIILVTHHPFFSVSSHAHDKLAFKEDVMQLLERYKVDLVFSGHDHNYERFSKDGIDYITTGGGGAPLYGEMASSSALIKFSKSYHYCQLTIKNDSLEIVAINDNAEEIDRMIIKK